MEYISTRGGAKPVSGARAVLQGLAEDGGLYLPRRLPQLDWRSCVCMDTLGVANAILSAFLPDIGDMAQLVRSAYAGKFETEDLTPTVPVEELYVLELFRGPTSAFKDVALCMLPRLMVAAREACGEKEEVLILTATSGDTGKAALEGFKDVPGTQICVFYPEGGVSDVQRRQMVSQEGANVHVCAVRGNFDDAQTGVKEVFAAQTGKNLSSANSINIGRLLPQITYYFTAYRDLLRSGAIQMGDAVNFSVPTGNFGDILAGYLAKLLGLPVGMLICASNANDVLREFLDTGRYDRRRPLLKTNSPSMDILVSSNLERLLYLMSGDADLVRGLMEQLKQQGSYQISRELHTRLTENFRGYACDDAAALSCIGQVWQSGHYLMDTHTAAAWTAARAYRAQTGDARPMVVLSTASAYKFPAAVLAAIGGADSGDEFDQMERLQAMTGVPIPKNLSGLRQKPERHTDVIDRADMLRFVQDL